MVAKKQLIEGPVSIWATTQVFSLANAQFQRKLLLLLSFPSINVINVKN
jgi:hypothetical protein